MKLENLKHGKLQVIELIKMTKGEVVGGLLGTALALGITLWGVEKITEALDSKKETSILNNTEPF